MQHSNLLRRKPPVLDPEVETALRTELRECANLEDMFASDGWEQFDAMLAEREEKAQGQVEQHAKEMHEILAARAHLKLLRELRGLPEATRTRRVRATEALNLNEEDS